MIPIISERAARYVKKTLANKVYVLELSVCN